MVRGDPIGAGMTLGKVGKVVLPPESFKKLACATFEADGWICSCCRRNAPLEAHHVIFRSIVRLDLDWNLVSLCHRCHEQVTQHKFYIIRPDRSSRQIRAVDKETYRTWVRERLEEARHAS